MLGTVDKSLFFIASFSPLWVIMMIRYLMDNYYEQYVLIPIIIPLVIITISILLTVRKFRTLRRSTNSEEIKVKKSKEITSEYIPYIISYLFPILTVIDDIGTLFAVLAAMTLVGILYVKTRMVFTNPALILAGFRIYEIESDDYARPIKIIAKKYPGTTIVVRDMDHDLCIEQK